MLINTQKSHPSTSGKITRADTFGFTLIELLVGIIIMTILFSLGYAGYRSFQRRQYLESAVRMVKADLRLSQELAHAGKKPSVGTCPTSSLDGYDFTRTGNFTYEIRVKCSGSPSSVMVKAVTLPPGIEMPGIVGGGTIRFYVLAKGTNRDPFAEIRLRFPTAAVTERIITVTKGGEIR